MKHMSFRFWCVLAIALNNSSHAAAEGEISDHFIDRAITGCINWIASGTLTYFNSDWILSDETRQMRELSKTSPELDRHESLFESPQHQFYAIIKEPAETKSCTIVENLLAVLMGFEEFDFTKGEAVLNRWGEMRAPIEGFVDWPEGAAVGFMDRDNTIFYKKRCSPSGVVIIDGMAILSPLSHNGMRLPSWSVTLEYFDRQIAEGDQNLIEYIDLACPQKS